MASLTGRVAVITGAGRGIGRACALALAADGADVALSARTPDEIETLAAEIGALGRRAIAVTGDVSQEEDCRRMVERAAAELGGLHLLVNNAGAVVREPLLQTSVEEWDRVITVNLRGTFLCTRFALPHMLAAGWGRVVNISSGAGKRGVANRTAYCAAKWGVNGFTEALDEELQGTGVRAHVVCPGPVATALRKEGFPDEDQSRLIQPEEVGEAVRYLVTLPPTAYIRELFVVPGDVTAARG